MLQDARLLAMQWPPWRAGCSTVLLSALLTRWAAQLEDLRRETELLEAENDMLESYARRNPMVRRDHAR